jgi:hypothetical protein
MAFHTETRVEVDAFDVDALILNDSGREQGIQPSGYQRDGFASLVHRHVVRQR